MRSLTLIQSRTKTPNYYLFRDLVEACKQSGKFTSVQASINGFQQIENCDFLLTFGGEEARNRILESTRIRAKKSLIWFTEDPYENKVNIEAANNYDHVFTTDSFSVSKYNGSANFLPLGVRKDLLSMPKPLNYHFDIVAFGSLWPNRIELLQEITTNPLTNKLKILLIGAQVNAPWVDQNELLHLNGRIIAAGGEVVNVKRPFDLRRLLTLAATARISLGWPRLFKTDSYSVPGPRIVEVGAARIPQLLDSASQPGLKKMFPQDTYFNFEISNVAETLSNVIELSQKELAAKTELMVQTIEEKYLWEILISQLEEKILQL